MVNTTSAAPRAWVTHGPGRRSLPAPTRCAAFLALLVLIGSAGLVSDAGAVRNWTITATAGPDGTITPSGEVSVPMGNNQSFTIAPSAGYATAGLVVDGVSVTPVAVYTFTNVRANHTISASFAIAYHTLSVSVTGSGSVTRNPDLAQYLEGSTVDLTAVPAPGYLFMGWSGAASGTTNPLTLTMDTNKNIGATFALPTYVITAAAGGGGTISPSGSVAVTEGASQGFIIAPGAGYHITSVLVDGVSLGAVASYTFTGVNAAHTIEAGFAPGSLLEETGATFPPYNEGSLPPAWGDYDGDGDMDLPLYRDDGSLTFSEIPGLRTLLAGQAYHGASWSDYDRDGNVDLVLLPYSGEEDPGAGDTLVTDRALLLHNQGDGTFVDVAPALGMDIVGFGETAVWGDFDGDGWPDLFTPYYAYAPPYRSFLWHNNRDGTFTDIAAAAGVDLSTVPQALKPEGAHGVDIDHDGDLDLYCASHLFINDGTGHFTDQRAAMGLPEVFDEGAMFVDIDDDGDFDLYLRTVTGPRLFRDDAGQFTEVTTAAGLPTVPLAWGDSWADVDNDGDLDLYLILPILQSARLYLNQGDGTFARDSTFTLYDTSGLNAWADLDRDGDLDLHVEAYNRHLLINTLDQRPGFAGSWLRVVAVDSAGQRTQQGATVELRRLNENQIQARAVDGGSGYLTQSEYAVHFGVDPAGTYALSVSFPSAGGTPVVVDGHRVGWLGAIVPGSLASQTITVFRDGRATLGEWTITAGATGGGTITPSGSVVVGAGEDRKFAIMAASGYHISDVVVDGVSVGPVASYKFSRVSAAHTIAANFVPTLVAGVEPVAGAPPAAIMLGPIRPNPMRDVARFTFGVPVATRVRLQVLDLMGREVAGLTDGPLPAGSFSLSWDGRASGRPAPAGMYFVRLQAGGRQVVRRLVLTR